MTNCIGIHSATLLAGTGIDRAHARRILVTEFQMTTAQADEATAEAYRLQAHPAEVGRQSTEGYEAAARSYSG